MAMIDCPECKKGISEQAVQCPHCGYPVRPAGATPPAGQATGNGCGQILVGMFVCAIAVGVLTKLGCNLAPESKVTVKATKIPFDRK